MSFTSNVQLGAVSIFGPSPSLGVIARSEPETFDKYKPCSPSDLRVMGKALCLDFGLCVSPQTAEKILQSLLRFTNGVNTALFVHWVWLSVGDRSDQSQFQYNQIKACITRRDKKRDFSMILPLGRKIRRDSSSCLLLLTLKGSDFAGMWRSVMFL